VNDPAVPSLEPSPAAAGATPVNRRRWWMHLLLLGAYPLFVGLAGWDREVARPPALSGDARGLLLACAWELLIFSLVFGLAWATSRASLEALWLRWRAGLWAIPLGIGYSIAIRVLLGVILLVLGTFLVITGMTTAAELREFFLANRPDVEAIVDVTALGENPLYFWLTITLVSFVVAGLREELWRAGLLAALRTLWPRWFGSRTGQLGAVTIAAAMFGLGHLPQGVMAVFLTGFLGLLLGCIMVLHRTIWPAVLAHGMFNATSFALLPWATERLHEIRSTLGH
jgi:membrane protease YdiL (CAAX protease family)